MLRVVGILLLACAWMSPVHGSEERPGPLMFSAPSGALAAKWQGAQQKMAEDQARLATCRAEPWTCSHDELRFEAIVGAARERRGRALIGEINRAVNLSIRPMSDERRFAVLDHWSGPLETLEAGVGDCEDYAILKLLALQEAGLAPEDLKLLIVQERTGQNAHAVAAARIDGRWLILDNRGFTLVDMAFTPYRILAQLDTGQEGRYASADPELENLRGTM